MLVAASMYSLDYAVFRTISTHEADPVLLRDDPVYQLHLAEDGALSALAGAQQQQLDLLLLCFVVLCFGGQGAKGGKYRVSSLEVRVNM